MPHLHPAPIHLLAGGRGGPRTQRDPLLETVLTATGKTAPTVAYIGAASGDDTGFFDMIAQRLRTCGAKDVILAPTVHPHLHHEANRDLAKTRQIIEDADLVFLSGGDVEAGMSVLETAGLVGFLRDLHRAGKPFFGLSAGSIILAREWVCWPDPGDEDCAARFECLGLAPVICDTHGEEDDWEELHAMLALTPDGTVGYGIPSGGALRVTPDGGVAALAVAAHVFTRLRGRVERLPDLAVETP